MHQTGNLEEKLKLSEQDLKICQIFQNFGLDGIIQKEYGVNSVSKR